LKIAYIEDDSDSLLIFSKKFKAEHIECDCFENAEDALKKIEPGSYDLLISDIRLPGMSGVELLAKLREKHVFTPCILITAFSDARLTKQALNASANYLLEKPFAYSALKSISEKIMLSPGSLQYCVDRGLEKLALTGREEEIARLMLKGLSNAEIARALSISEKTVKQYVSQLFGKAAVSSRSEFFSHIFPL
jgi:DNA-binding NarL/FixJ family response regulator